MGGRNAVVIGGGLAGTLAVRALLGHTERITVVERDRYPQRPEFRKGVPQARHLHIFVTAGQEALDELLPGTCAELAAAGARTLEIPRDLLTCGATGWQIRFHEGRHRFMSCTRPLLDHVVRRRVLAAAAESGTEVEILEATEAVALLGSAQRVTGVRVRGRGERRGEREIPATLVVDAAGRASRAPRWLAELGRPAPREETVDAGLQYATRALRLPTPPDAAVYIPYRRDNFAGGGLLPVEDGTWLLTVSGIGGLAAPSSEAEFAAFTGRLVHPYLHELVAGAEPLSPVHGSRETSNRRRHYHAPGGVPEGFVATGDAACSFNPVYGQGMAVAALGALALRRVLDERGGPRPGFAPVAQRALARAADAAWMMAAGADRPYAEAGKATAPALSQRVQGWYFERFLARAAVDPVVGAVYRDVVTLTAPPARMFSPAVALRTVLLPRRPALADPPR
ncbi:NAD(P)/FAD-dependent oxidoreductase [Actinacidiphila sp. bgisy160]|uniref:NAD(P)/FAD-dependent oxidoreductase n=1 Tax=Actinacidiphila sp. bgisy160 TaxID=3413796 RepID=UPI003D7166E2